MTIQEAKTLIAKGVEKSTGTWADIGAGTGMFTLALMELLEEGTIYAVDKSPHALWKLEAKPGIGLHIVEGDFTRPLDLPELDGIVMANALHYAHDPLAVLNNVLSHLKPGGSFILVEYDTDTARSPWVPFPVSLKAIEKLTEQVGLTKARLIESTQSQYGYDRIYAAHSKKPG